MITCSICKHWRKIRDEDHKAEEDVTWPGPHGECMLIDEFSTDKKGWIYVSSMPIDNRSPVTMNNVDIEPSLITNPDFGCIHGETEDAPLTK